MLVGLERDIKVTGARSTCAMQEILVRDGKGEWTALASKHAQRCSGLPLMGRSDGAERHAAAADELKPSLCLSLLAGGGICCPWPYRRLPARWAAAWRRGGSSGMGQPVPLRPALTALATGKATDRGPARPLLCPTASSRLRSWSKEQLLLAAGTWTAAPWTDWMFMSKKGASVWTGPHVRAHSRIGPALRMG